MEKSKKAGVVSSFGSFFLALLLAFSIRWILFEAYVIPSGSMLPSLLINDHIFVNKYIYGIRLPFSKIWLTKFKEPSKGEVVVFKFPEDEDIYFIKRVVATPGDRIKYENGVLSINDQEIERKLPSSSASLDMISEEDLRGKNDEYVHFEESIGGHNFDILLRRGEVHDGVVPTVVPPNKLFVMGDNRDNSNDSRYWGFVPIENVIGRAMFVWLSCEKTFKGRMDFLCEPSSIRWSRFFHSIH